MVQSGVDRTVFVCGTGRSGTSVTHVVLGANQGFAALDDLEARFLTSWGGLLDMFRALGSDFGVDRAAAAVENFRYVMQSMAVGGLYGDLGFDRRLGEDHYWSAIERFIETLGGPRPRYRSDDDEILSHMRTFLEDLLGPALESGDRWVDGTPHTLMQARFLIRLLPGSQFLHVTRDPRAVAVSLSRQVWAPDDIVGCAEWLESVYRRLQDETRVIEQEPGRYHHVRFEDLCLDSHGVAQELASFLAAPHLSFAMVEFGLLHATAWVDQLSAEDSRYLVDRFSWVYDLYGYERDVEWWRERRLEAAT